MEYWSRTGTVCYYDFKEYRPCICEPTLLFLLGFEAAVTPSSEYINLVPVIDHDTGEQAVDPETGEPVFEETPNEDRLKTCIISRESLGEEQFKKAFFYIYDKFPKDEDTEINFVPKNLKVSLNCITGTSSNRTMPIIYHDHFNEQGVDDYDAEAQKLLDILDCAGYKVKDKEVPYIGKFNITNENDLALIDERNVELKESHEKKKLYSQIYKTLDYKAMYVYALGVLYGCKRSDEENANLIWRPNTSWYTGEYKNLITTASAVFRFHYTHHICLVDVDPHLFKKYKGIQTNKVWDFNEANTELKSDEVVCTVLSIENGEAKETTVIYSKSSNEYLIPEENEWKPLDKSVLSSDPKIGVTLNEDPVITTYFANDEITISKAYKLNKNKSLSPSKDENYFIHTNNIGWTNFDENSYKQFSDDNNTLTLTARNFDYINQCNFGLVRRKSDDSEDDSSLLAYYKCYLNGDTKLLGRKSIYGVTSNFVLSEIPDNVFFTSLFETNKQEDEVDDSDTFFTEPFVTNKFKEDYIHIPNDVLFDDIMSEESFYENYTIVLAAGIHSSDE